MNYKNKYVKYKMGRFCLKLRSVDRPIIILTIYLLFMLLMFSRYIKNILFSIKHVNVNICKK